MIVRTYQIMKILLFRFWVRSKNIVEAHFSTIVAISPSVFCTWKVMCDDVGRAPILVYVRKCVGGDSAKILTPIVHFHFWKKVSQKILSLIGLSVCLISLCSSLIGLCACLISLSQKKTISTGLFWEKLVEKCKAVPDYVHFFHKLVLISLSNRLTKSLWRKNRESSRNYELVFE